MPKVILFVRVSTESQHLESQEDALRRAALYDGHKEEDIIVIGKKESAIKLDEEEREGLQELYHIIDNQDVDCIYIHELSRLSRRPPILYSVREKLLNSHVQLKCVNPSFTLLTPDKMRYDATANIVFSLFGAMAEQEMIEKKERFRRGKRRKAEEGKYNGGNIPFGYKKDPEHDNLIVVDEEQARLVRLCYDLYEKGYSQPKLAKEMEERGHSELKISLINHILNNISYTGYKRCRKGSSYERVYPVIITPEQFLRCRDAADDRSTRKFNAGHVYYADHLIKCESCGAIWSASGSKVRYRCYASSKADTIWKYEYHKEGEVKCTNKTGISINILDSLLWHLAQQLECDYILNTAKEDQEKYRKQIASLKQKLGVVDSRLDDIDLKRERVADSYVEGLYSKDKRDEKLSKLDSEKKGILSRKVEMESELSHLELLLSDVTSKYNFDDVNGVYDTLKQYDELYKQMSMIENDKERSEIIHRHIKEIRVRDSQVEYKFDHLKEPKLTPAKFIKITLYKGNVLYFYYVCQSKKNGILEADKNGKVKKEINVPRLDRFVDHTKLRIHEKERLKRDAERDKLFPAKDGWIFGFDSAAKFLQISSATLHRHTLEGNFKGAVAKLEGLNVFNVFKIIECIVNSEEKWSRYIEESWKRKHFDYKKYLG